MSAHCCVEDSQFSLPAEMWILVFSHLTAADKLSVRAACKHFKKLIDYPPLWRNWTVVLHFPDGPYSHKFWVTLRRRGVCSVVLRSSKPREWIQAAKSLPALSTLVVERCSQESLESLWSFNHLKRLAVRGGVSPLVFVSFMLLSHLRQVTHLSLCDVQVPLKSFAVSHFAGLTSLVCHNSICVAHSLRTFYSILTGLPKLKHLSWSMKGLSFSDWRQRPRPGLRGGSSLSSLELVDYVHPLLSEDVMKLVPGLQSLSVFYRKTEHDTRRIPGTECHLKRWLEDLQHLSSLVIVGGPSIRQYADFIPTSVTRLTLSHVVSSVMETVVAKKVPDLLHLHLHVCWTCGDDCSQIPQLFPKLESLTVSPVEIIDTPAWISSIQQLRQLKHLHILSLRPEVTHKFQDLTHYGVQVSVHPCKDLLECPCLEKPRALSVHF